MSQASSEDIPSTQTNQNTFQSSTASELSTETSSSDHQGPRNSSENSSSLLSSHQSSTQTSSQFNDIVQHGPSSKLIIVGSDDIYEGPQPQRNLDNVQPQESLKSPKALNNFLKSSSSNAASKEASQSSNSKRSLSSYQNSISDFKRPITINSKASLSRDSDTGKSNDATGHLNKVEAGRLSSDCNNGSDQPPFTSELLNTSEGTFSTHDVSKNWTKNPEKSPHNNNNDAAGNQYEEDIPKTPLSVRERIKNLEGIADSYPLSNNRKNNRLDFSNGEDSHAQNVAESFSAAAMLPESPVGSTLYDVNKGNIPNLVADVSLEHNVIESKGNNDEVTSAEDLNEIEGTCRIVPPPLVLPSLHQPSDQLAAYTGYEPKIAADFVAQSKATLHGDQDILSVMPAASVPLDTRTDIPVPVSVSFFLVLIGIILFILSVTPAICRLGVCGKLDRSSVPSSPYLFQTLEFSAPFPFLFIPTAFQLFCFAFLIARFKLLVKRPVPELPFAVMAAHVQYAVFQKYHYIALVVIIVSVPVFVLCGFCASWTTAIAFIAGLIPTVVSPYIALLVSTRAASRLATHLSTSVFEAYAQASRAATVIPVTSFVLTFFCLTLCYFIVRDVRALLGFVLGTALPTLLIRVSVAIFTNFPRPAQSSRFHPNDVRNPAAPLPSAAAHLIVIAGSSAQLCATLATSIVAPAILASSLPYFENNPFALCVQNHLHIDRTCVAYTATRLKFSFAVGLCRLRNFYEAYPVLSDRESIASFVAIPFILAISILAQAVVVAVSMRRPPRDPRGRINTEEVNVRAATRRRLTPFFVPMLVRRAIDIPVILLVSGIIILLMFGSPSLFYGANEGTVPRYKFPNTASSSGRCTPRDSPGIGLVSTEFPRLAMETAKNHFSNGFGETVPNAKDAAWRLFMCVMLGLMGGVWAGLMSGMVSSRLQKGSRRAAAIADDGLGSEIAVGVGMGTIIGTLVAAITALLTIGCYYLYGGFGVGICAIGMAFSVGMVGSFDAIGLITKEGLRLLVVCRASGEALHRGTMLGAVGELFQGCGRSVCIASSVMSTISLLWVLIEQTGVLPSPREFTGNALDKEPTRHITDVDRVDLLERGVLPATVSGLVFPFILCPLVTLTASRVSKILGQAIENEMQRRGKWERGEIGEYDGCIMTNVRTATVESLMVCSALIIGTISSSLWYGSRGLIAMAVGALASGSILSLAAVVAGARVEGMRLFRLELITKDKIDEDVNSERRTWNWEEIGTEWASGCVTALMLFIVSGGAVAARALPLDGQRWWVGFIIAGVWALIMMLVSWVVAKQENMGTAYLGNRAQEEDNDIRLNQDVQSPFFEEAAQITRKAMNPSSPLRHAEMGSSGSLRPLGSFSKSL